MIQHAGDGTTPHLVIVGGGFAGLYAARALRNAPIRLTVVDRRNHHLFQPLLYQVATAALNPSDIAAPIRSILRGQRNTSVILGDVQSVDRTRKQLILSDGALSYDYLIIATGATHSYFGNESWKRFAPGLKSIEDALEIRRRILLAFEAAERETDAAHRAEWLTFVVVGGGPTGVELAGALSEIARYTLSRDFRNIDPGEARVILLEGLPRILPTYPEELSRKGQSQLEGLGVDVRTGERVTAIDEEGVEIGGKRIATRTVLWAAGVQASPLAQSLHVPLDRAGRVIVRPDLTIPGDDDVFVIGDLAAVPHRDGLVPGVAPAAIQEGRHAAANLLRRLRGAAYTPFTYKDKGSLATIGRGSGIADLPFARLSGLVAWVAWLAIHIFFLIGFRNRLLVMIQWAWSYFTHQRGARLITGQPEDLLPGSRTRSSSSEA